MLWFLISVALTLVKRWQQCSGQLPMPKGWLTEKGKASLWITHALSILIIYHNIASIKKLSQFGVSQIQVLKLLIHPFAGLQVRVLVNFPGVEPLIYPSTKGASQQNRYSLSSH